MLVFMLITAAAHSNPNRDYIDYLPKYRSHNKNFILTKIIYTSDKMIIHFQYIATKDKETIRFSGISSPNPWQISTSSRGTTDLNKNASLENIVINGILKTPKITGSNEVDFLANKGEIVAGEALFSKLDKTVRTVNFIGSDIVNCLDILIKEENNDLLGTEEQMQANINRFYNMVNSFGGNVIMPSKTSANTVEKKSPPIVLDKKEPPAKEPAPTYEPKDLLSVKDMVCNNRAILKNVYFNDNSPDYQGRVEALKTIQIIIDYMNLYPQSTIILHGHTDIFGDPSNNLQLSEDRVLTVKRTIVQNNIAPDRIKTLSHGSNQPLAEFVKGGSKNRRVEVELICNK